MPELPEVETVVRGLRAPLVGRTVTDAWTDWPKAVKPSDMTVFNARIQGQTFRAIERRAKYIVCRLDHNIVAIHLKMSGRLYVAAGPHDGDRWVHFRLGLDDGQYLCFSDARRFGRVYLAADIATIAPDLGPEPLADDFTVKRFRERLAGRHRQIKALLLDQTCIAGVGNIYADESLHRAGIYPLRPADTLTKAETARLYRAVRAALNDGIERQGASINWYRTPDGQQGTSQDYFDVYGRAGEPCHTCGQTIVKTRVAQRGTHFCPNCQPEK
jgi:formamidopyrimidine-DNA glycosylase